MPTWDFEIPPRNGQPVTLRNLLTHTPGFEDRAKSLMTSDAEALEPLGQYLKAWIPGRIFPAGQIPAYSNYGAALAGYIVQRVSGQPFDDYVEQHILDPLGMRHSSFRQPLPDRLKPGMSKGYKVASEPAKPYELVTPRPAGSLTATGADMARFMIAHLQDGRYGSARILEPATAELMHSTPLTIVPSLNRMLLGFFESSRNGRRIIEHAGDTQWFHSNLLLYPDDGVGLFISLNSLGKEAAAGPIRTAVFEQFTDRYFPGPAPEGTVDEETAAEHARLMAGRYVNTRGSASNFLAVVNLIGQLEVTDNDDGTISAFTGLNGEPKRWREIAPFVWRDFHGEDRLAARVRNGEVVMFSTDQVSPFMMFQPVSWWKSAAWLLPALGVAFGALLLTALFWPVTALVRRSFHASFPLTGRDARAYRLVRGAAAAVVVTLLAWVGTVAAMASNFDLLSPKLDWLIWILHFLALVVFVGATAIALWNVWVVWTGPRGWFAKLWSPIVAGSCLVVLWAAFAFKLIAFSTSY